MQKNSRNEKKRDEWNERLLVMQKFLDAKYSPNGLFELLTNLILSPAFLDFAQRVPSLMHFYHKQFGQQMYA